MENTYLKYKTVKIPDYAASGFPEIKVKILLREICYNCHHEVFNHPDCIKECPYCGSGWD